MNRFTPIAEGDNWSFKSCLVKLAGLIDVSNCEYQMIQLIFSHGSVEISDRIFKNHWIIT